MSGKPEMSAKQLMLEMVLALLLAIFAMSLDDVHATSSRDFDAVNATCLQLPALSGQTGQADNDARGGHTSSDESSCSSASGPAKASFN